jgi:hypothetical protein
MIPERKAKAAAQAALAKMKRSIENDKRTRAQRAASPLSLEEVSHRAQALRSRTALARLRRLPDRHAELLRGRALGICPFALLERLAKVP